jgi:hypothetical protein
MRTALAIFMILTVIVGVVVVNWESIVRKCYGTEPTDRGIIVTDPVA